MKLSRRAPLAAAVIAVALLAGCGAASSPAPVPASAAKTGSPPPPSTPASIVTSAPASPRPSGPPTALPVAPGAGALPQTRTFPGTDSAAFRDAMQDVWLAVTTGNARLALPAFFPRAAYQKLKAIYDPAADWDDRLWYDFTLDVRAAHQAVAPDAHLVRVLVAGYDAAWVYPGVCDNSIGYWHVSGARMVYRQHGQERSIGIASLISWRGVWYVVHFGAVLRSVVTGIVDDPEPGPGVPGPAGGC
ncbi:MAG TPA: hypothetical protein VK280_01440 [Streptosporangiaceae bacterium]|nr:hypothetical protein [Streptosporangiaceae bacterium]